MVNALGVLLQKLSIAVSLLLVALAQAQPVNVWEGYMQLKKVAACESTGSVENEPRQFNSDGSILWGNDPATGKPVKRDCGELQINTIAHAKEIATLGLDVCNSEADNIVYGKILYDREGLTPWFASRNCWSGKR